MEVKKSSNFFLTKDCSLLIVNIFSVISLDLENKDLFFFFDISFFLVPMLLFLE